MPLSPEEQQRLKTIERHLSLEDPDLARKMRSGSGGTAVRVSHVWVPLMLLIGVMALPVGIATQLAIVAVLGFILAAAGAYGAIGNSRFGHPEGNRLDEIRGQQEKR
ncbi:DUF3040 domain-containing protein [Arthrobacter sp. CAU 1506]|uniref:DUF3040 domain-containing protein n=1 Tax=Arthrobacter sp. CAU 1506 TaxID=2560052 RepID=UPI00145FC4F0|nr:DUF3040 domain-containing protein [Arthrobacter sp. CAU 1506]